jgi:uncharacterized membrane protein
MSGSKSRNSSDAEGSGAVFGVLFILAILWWLRWIILAAVLVTVVVWLTRLVVRHYQEHRDADQARLAAIRRRAEIQNAQVRRGDPAGFFGRYPVPDRELIPTWYKACE